MYIFFNSLLSAFNFCPLILFLLVFYFTVFIFHYVLSNLILFLVKIYTNLLSRDLGATALEMVNFKGLLAPSHLIPAALCLGLCNKPLI